ncbi:MAG: hypothetical protein EZS28_035849, partial [Streblomastix strix]
MGYISKTEAYLGDIADKLGQFGCLIHSKDYRKKLSIGDDKSSWASWEAHFITDSIELGIISSLRSFLPPYANTEQEINIIIYKQRDQKMINEMKRIREKQIEMKLQKDKQKEKKILKDVVDEQQTNPPQPLSPQLQHYSQQQQTQMFSQALSQLRVTPQRDRSQSTYMFLKECESIIDQIGQTE